MTSPLSSRITLLTLALLWVAAPPAVRAQDLDEDGVPDATDNCVRVPNGAAEDDQADTDADGIGNACECGDASGDGRVNTTDARLIQLCRIGHLPCPVLCDVTGEDLCNTTDARLIQRLAVGEIGKADLSCVERCEHPGCPVCGDSFCDPGERCGGRLPACRADCGLCASGERCIAGDLDCAGADVCDLGTCTPPGSRSNGEACERDAVCASGLCDGVTLLCIEPGSKSDGDACTRALECASGECNQGLCGPGCDDLSERPLGCPCVSDPQCASRRCEFTRCVPLDCRDAFEPCQADSECCGADQGGPLRCRERPPIGSLCLPD